MSASYESEEQIERQVDIVLELKQTTDLLITSGRYCSDFVETT